jgi:hypothetical protein
MSNSLPFLSGHRSKSYSYAPFYLIFGSAVPATLKDGFFQFKETPSRPLRNKNIISKKKGSSFKYDEWHWEDIKSTGRLDDIKDIYPGITHLFIFKDYRSVVNVLLRRDMKLSDLENADQGFFSRIVWYYFKRKKALQRLYVQKAPRYLKIWLRYNDALFKNIKNLPRENYVLLDQKNIGAQDASVSAYMLKNWNLSLKYFRLKQINNISPTVEDVLADVSLDEVIFQE